MRVLYSTITFLLILLNTNVGYAAEQKVVFPMSSNDKSLTLEFKGEIYDNKTLLPISDKSTHAVAAFLNVVIKANASGDKSAILNLWTEKDKKVMEPAMSKRAIEHSASLFKNMKSSSLMGYIEYGDYIICYVYHDINNGQGETYLKEYPLKSTPNGYAMTNELSSDTFFSQISYKLGKHIWPR